jgi:hypothetical protein
MAASRSRVPRQLDLYEIPGATRLQAQLEAWRLIPHERPRILPALVASVAALCPGFGQRRMTFEDFLAVCGRQGIAVTVRPEPLVDGQLNRRPWPRVTLRAGLVERFRIFAAFHELAHSVGHPRTTDAYLALGRRTRYDHQRQVELEAHTIGLLAVEPPAPGRPPLRVECWEHDRDGWAFDVREAEETGGRVARRSRRIVLRRLEAVA